jgi:hypothetical protein
LTRPRPEAVIHRSTLLLCTTRLFPLDVVGFRLSI